MKKTIQESPLKQLLILGLFMVLICGPLHAASPNVATARVPSQTRTTLSFDTDWRFSKGDTTGAQRPETDDTTWRKLDVPHDWSIEGPFDKENKTGGAGGFLPYGVAWYRKHFQLPTNYNGRRVFVDFDGVMANSDVWINGFHLGRRPYGYISFRYELTGHLNFGNGSPNVLAVRADTSEQPASRWYTGAGIYRHVRLVVTDPVHFEQWGNFISTPKVTAANATVRVQSTVINQSDTPSPITVKVTLFDPSGRVVQSAETKPQTVPPGKSVAFEQDLTVNNPQRWDLDRPNLYRAVTEVRSRNTPLDDETTTFGIRDAHFEADTGFWLNGRNFKLKGVCLHHEAGGFGAAVPLRAWERRLELLRELGVNAIRTAHNPPAPEFLDLCDRMGFLVMDELFDCWTVAKNPYDYHLYFKDWANIDLRDTVRRDRNHPSVVIYSAGNEIHDTPKPELAKPILSSLVATFHENDPTRPVTQGLFRPNVSHDYDNGLADILDVVGQNYRENEILAAYKQKPTRKILGTENTHVRSMWLAMRDNAPYAGQFIWTGIDYLGESPGWPTIGHGSGLLDRTGTARSVGYERQSWWSATPMVHITRRVAPTQLSTDPGYEPGGERLRQMLYADWTPRNTAVHDENVEVYSNCEQVELFLNGKSLGSQPRPADDAPRTWKVPFQAGTLKAIGANHGKQVATHQLTTAGPPARIILSADRSTIAPIWDDVSYITATVVDANGVIAPFAADLISFKVSGPGVIAAVDNGDNNSHEPFQAKERKAYQGRCFALIKAYGSGPITIAATAQGLAPGSTSIQARPLRRT